MDWESLVLIRLRRKRGYMLSVRYIYEKKFNISKYITAAAGDDRPFRTP